MKVYFACTGKKEPLYLAEAGFKEILCSYFYYKKDPKTIKKLNEMGVHVFIDSGAHSAHNAGKHIDIDDYSKYCIENEVKFFAGLDVIRGPQESFDNWIYQKKEYNLESVPTFHYGESLDFLHLYLDKMANCNYLALGGMIAQPDLEQWLDSVWSVILKERPDMQVHGFGMTTSNYIYKYPWTSFDSSSFKSGKRFGRVPQFNGEKLYNISWKQYQKRIIDQEGNESILEDNQRCQRLSDIEGAKAYFELVKYYNSFDRKFGFQNQMTLF